MESTAKSNATTDRTNATVDTNAIRLGGSFRLPALAPASVANGEKVRLGGSFRLPSLAPSSVADDGKVRLGGSFCLPTEHG